MGKSHSSGGGGRIAVVGIGPGSVEHITVKAKDEIERADVIVGYTTYIDLIRPLIKPTAEVITGRMGEEIERAKIAVKKALDNKRVAVISSGDAGVYGMAGPVLEVAEAEGVNVPIEIIPGVTAATAGAAKLGAPIMVDFAVISLSDILTPWSEIEKRLKAAAESDFVIILYNPQSRTRQEPIVKAYQILLEYRDADTPVGIMQNVGRQGEKAVITTLREMIKHEIDMTTTIIVGNSKTKIIGGKMVTSRGYDVAT
ncbi:MAG: precorrin-3B C(17)-methyltransferase [Candidatus Bathyarchaeota archaeon]|nr:precorrin-3B C(17)-methyltransferase [Candidatus Bathyarchaeota archaeon]MCX8177216.1 precorrin-3B C(17)-methyltransferase [Candidatus Bathyarchaeota archaeon]